MSNTAIARSSHQHAGRSSARGTPRSQAEAGCARSKRASPKVIAIDLTQVLPGGESGGIKVFVLELLDRLAAMAPKTRFILLTQAASHEELATLDRANMRRVLVTRPGRAASIVSRVRRFLLPLWLSLPGRVKRALCAYRYRLRTTMRRFSGRRLLRNLRVDLLFCPFTALTYHEPGIPAVCTIHDLQYKTYPQFFSLEDFVYREHILADACREAAALAAVSEYTRETAFARAGSGSLPIRTIHHRLARRICPEDRQDPGVLQRLSLAPGRYLVYPANFWRHKNHEMLLTAFGMACRAALPPDIKLICTGAPDARQQWLIRSAHVMGLSSRVLFPGYLPESEFAALLTNGAAMIFPSLYEGFGLPVIEAMAAGVPVGCSNVACLPEVAGDAAIMFDPRVPTQIADGMIALVSDQPLRSRLIAAGRRRAAEFADSHRMVEEYWELFQDAFNGEVRAA